MDKKQFVDFAISIINTYSGDFDYLGPFLDSVHLVNSFVDDSNRELFFQLIKSRISGPARAFIPKYCHCVEDIVTCLEANIQPDSTRALTAKLKAIARDIQGEVNVVGFVEHAEELVDKLVYAFIVEKGDLVNHARSNAINVCAKVFEVIPDVKTPREVLHKYLDSVMTKKPRRING